MLAAASLALHTWVLHGRQGKTRSTCGTYAVYENRAAASGRKIALKFIIIRAVHGSKRAIAWNPGGPGASSTAFAGPIADGGVSGNCNAARPVRYPARQQPGTGGSAPQQCDFRLPIGLRFYFRQLWPTSSLRAVARVSRARSDLSLYTTSVAADDLNDLRGALGYPKLVSTEARMERVST